jgi:hypothetical protein
MEHLMRRMFPRQIRHLPSGRSAVWLAQLPPPVRPTLLLAFCLSFDSLTLHFLLSVLSTSSSGELEDAYSRLSIVEGSDVDKEAPVAARKLLEAMAVRDRYAALNPRQLKWSYDGTNAFAIDNLPAATTVRNRGRVFVARCRPAGASLVAPFGLWGHFRRASQC